MELLSLHINLSHKVYLRLKSSWFILIQVQREKLLMSCVISQLAVLTQSIQTRPDLEPPSAGQVRLDSGP